MNNSQERFVFSFFSLSWKTDKAAIVRFGCLDLRQDVLPGGSVQGISGAHILWPELHPIASSEQHQPAQFSALSIFQLRIKTPKIENLKNNLLPVFSSLNSDFAHQPLGLPGNTRALLSANPPPTPPPPPLVLRVTTAPSAAPRASTEPTAPHPAPARTTSPARTSTAPASAAKVMRTAPPPAGLQHSVASDGTKPKHNNSEINTRTTKPGDGGAAPLTSCAVRQLLEHVWRSIFPPDPSKKDELIYIITFDSCTHEAQQSSRFHFSLS